MVKHVIAIALGGAVGSVARFGLATFVQRAHAMPFPFGTLAVNMVGCFCFGVFWAVAAKRETVPAELQAAVVIGFLGAFTTFSTFAFESEHLARTGHLWEFAANLVAQNAGGVLLMAAGLALGRSL
jgi:CrcB protein